MPSVSQDHGLLPSSGVAPSATKVVSFSTQGLLTQSDHLMEEAGRGGIGGEGVEEEEYRLLFKANLR